MNHHRTCIVVLLVICVHTFIVDGACPFKRRSKEEGSANDLLQHFIQPASKAEERSTSTDPLEEMNQLLQEAYSATKQQLLRIDLQKYPLIIMDGENFIFWHNNATRNFSAIPTEYTNMKLVSHIAFATFVLLEMPAIDGQLAPESKTAIQQYVGLMPQAVATFTERNFTSEQLHRAYLISNKSNEILQSTLSSGRINRTDIDHYARSLTKAISDNIEDAALSQLLLTDKLVQQFRKNVTEEEWNEMFVVVLGSHMARHGAILMQYFSKLLNTRASSGERVVYAEGLDLEGALELLATHLIDFSVGEAFWNNPEHMHWDVLAPAAHKILPWILHTNGTTKSYLDFPLI